MFLSNVEHDITNSVRLASRLVSNMLPSHNTNYSAIIKNSVVCVGESSYKLTKEEMRAGHKDMHSVYRSPYRMHQRQERDYAIPT